MARAIKRLPVAGMGSAPFARSMLLTIVGVAGIFYMTWTLLMVWWLPSPLAVLSLTVQGAAWLVVVAIADQIKMATEMRVNAQFSQSQRLIGAAICLRAFPPIMMIMLPTLIRSMNEEHMAGLEDDERRHLVNRLRLNIVIFNKIVETLEEHGRHLEIDDHRDEVLVHAFRLHQVLASQPLGTVTDYSAMPIEELWQAMQEWKFDLERRLGGNITLP